MHTIVVALIGFALAGLVGLVAFLPSRQGLMLTIVALLVIPAPLAVVNPVTSFLTVDRGMVLVLLIRMIFEVRAHHLRRAIFSVTPLHVVLYMFLVACLMLGVFHAQPGILVGDQIGVFWTRAFLAIVFVTILAGVRAHGATTIVKPLCIALAITTAIALWEHWSKLSFWHEFAKNLPSQNNRIFSRALEPRNHDVRVRASSEFALQFAWYTAALIPMALAYLTQRKRPYIVTAAALATIFTAIYWSSTRSVLAGVAIALVSFWLLSRAERVGRIVTVSLIIGVVATAASPALRHHFSEDVNKGSISIRSDRNHLVAKAVAETPLTGLGFNARQALKIKTTDNDIVTNYLEIGALGLTVMLAVVSSGLLAAVRTGRIRDPEKRLIGAALAAGALVLAAASSSLDSFGLGQTGWLFFVLVAGALAISEEELGPVRLPSLLRPWRILLPVAGLGIGALIFTLSSTHASIRQNVFALPILYAGDTNPVALGDARIASVCTVATTTTLPERTSIDCRNPHVADGVAELTIRSFSLASARQSANEILAHEHEVGLTTVAMLTTEERTHDKDTYARVAPAVGGLLGLITAVTIPVGGPLQRMRAASALQRRQRRKRRRIASAQPAS